MLKSGMHREVIATEDGSSTLFVPELNEHYHSVHGAVQESMHVYIRAGVEFCNREHLRILEAGFGTGLNAYLAFCHAEERNIVIDYHSFEKYPLSQEEVLQLSYSDTRESEGDKRFALLHACEWNEDCPITPRFTLHKYHDDFSSVDFEEAFDIVFFDAFNPDVQPHLWTDEVLGKFCRALKPGGIFVTYCVKGIVKQALRRLGLSVKRLPGPPGKREMLRGTKNL